MGVAMGSGSDATRAVAQLVLLDDSFASLPAVVGEGRRVIANVERVANLFVTKSVYSFLLAMLVGVAGLTFPFLPRHLTIVSSLTIGIPAFFLAFAPNQPRARPGFVRRVALFAGPAGLVASVATFGGYVLADGPDVTDTHAEARTGAVIVLFLVAFWVLAILARPMTTARVALLAALGSAFALALALPWTQEFFALDPPSAVGLFAMIGVAAVAIAVLEGGWRLVGWQREHIDAAEIIARVRRPLAALDPHAPHAHPRAATPTATGDPTPRAGGGASTGTPDRGARRQTSS
jgi:cation-transporting ATPase E